MSIKRFLQIDSTLKIENKQDTGYKTTSCTPQASCPSTSFEQIASAPIQYNAMKFNSSQVHQCNTVQFNEIPVHRFNTMQYNSMQFNTMPLNSIKFKCTDTMQFNALHVISLQFIENQYYPEYLIYCVVVSVDTKQLAFKFIILVS